MWVGIVGSRSLGECACSARAKSWPPTLEEAAHAEECPKVVEWIRMLTIVGRWMKHEDLEGFTSGGAPGADTLAQGAAELSGYTLANKTFKLFPVQKGPGSFAERAHRRNQQIVDRADVIVAVFAPGPRSPGTTNTLTKAKAKGIPSYVYHNGRWTQE